jgi:hypothetical protein
MIKLSPTAFPFGRYEGLTIPSHIQMTDSKSFVKWLKEQNIIGYIDGMELEIRPRTDSYGVMIEDENGYETWAHVPNDIWEKYLEEENDQN